MSTDYPARYIISDCPVHKVSTTPWTAAPWYYLARLRAVCWHSGTGRLTRAIAEARLAVTGIDLTPEMLARARSLSAGLDIEWIQGDVRTMQLGRKFRLIIMTSHGFQHDFFERTREHILEDGYLS